MTPETLELHKLDGAELVQAVLNRKWFAKPNDVIGGWCVMPVDEVPSGGCFEVADFIGQEVADHIAKLHNTSLEVAKHRAEFIDALQSAIDQLAPVLSLSPTRRSEVYMIIERNLRKVVEFL